VVLQDHMEDLDLILGAAAEQETKPVMALVGATMNEDIIETAVAKVGACCALTLEVIAHR
jgi:hypothetical protein